MDFETAFPVAVSNFIFDKQERFLFFSRDGACQWRVMGGQLELNETTPQCIHREIKEELGEIQYRFLDVLDAHVFEYRAQGPIMSIFCLLEYEAGEIVPSSDMESYKFRWLSFDELRNLDIECPYQFELIEKAFFSLRNYKKNGNLSFLIMLSSA